jgi:hypothetical protein
MQGADKILELTEKLDKKALASAVGLMCLSWAALPVVYWLIVRKKNDEKIYGTGKRITVQKVRSESKEAEKK